MDEPNLIQVMVDVINKELQKHYPDQYSTSFTLYDDGYVKIVCPKGSVHIKVSDLNL